MAVGKSKEAPRRRRRFTEELKAKAVQDALRDGISAAAAKHGVHASSVSRWVSHSKKCTEGDATPGTRAQRTRRTARRYTPSQVSEALEYAAAHGVSEAAKSWG